MTVFRTSLVPAFMLAAAISVQLLAQKSVPQNASDDDPQYGLMIVIFSPQVDVSRTALAQKVVWDGFVAKLKNKNVGPLEAMNEITISAAADRARAIEIAGIEPDKYTMWVQFMSRADAIETGTKADDTLSDLVVARYIIFEPHSDKIRAQGDIEQEKPMDNPIQTADNQKALRNERGQVVNARADHRQPDGSSFNGPKLLDNTSLQRLGERLAERTIAAIRTKK
jgi:hypothetical protein